MTNINKILATFLFFTFCIYANAATGGGRASDITDDIQPRHSQNVSAVRTSSPLVVAEIVGLAESILDGQTKRLAVGDTVLPGERVVTGLQSSLSLSIVGQSYITINQLASVSIVANYLSQNSLECTVSVDSGLVVFNTIPDKGKHSSLNIATAVGTLQWTDAAGQVYVGSDHGVLVSLDAGKVVVKPRIKTIYSLKRRGMCAITKDGYLIDQDTLIRAKITAVPSNTTDPDKIAAFISRIAWNGSSERYTNDFYDNRHK